ncbi:MAG TPA: hypothetical protein VGR57_02355 [Ktedonobacterales bacterium]|nr:hypothetical protein [Ktedonobacterales bacterium]
MAANEPAPYPRYQPPPPLPNPHKTRDFFIGLGLGLIPGIVAIIGIGTFYNLTGPVVGTLLGVGAILYVAGIVATIVLLSIRRTQRIGVGLLVAIAMDPVIFGIGCVVALTRGPVL